MEKAFIEIDSYLTEIKKLNIQKNKFCKLLASINPDLANLPPHLETLTYDEKMFTKLSPQDIAGLTIGGVDGGYISRLLVGFDIFIFRAIAVFSTYTPAGIQKTSYFPSKTPPLEIAVSDVGLSSLDSENMGSIRRTITELHVATQVLELGDKKLDILLLDGSPVLKKPLTNNSRILNYYKSYLSALKRLIYHSNKTGIKLAWVVKDSRIDLFTRFLGKIIPFFVEELPEVYSLDYRSIINRSRDMDLFYYLLKPNFRSFIYRHHIDMPEEFTKEYSLFAYYLKPVPFDIPLRIEVFLPIKRNKNSLINDINILSEAILPLSQYNREYGVPSPIVEADARARIKESEIDALFQLIRIRNPTPDLWIRRRERAPWKF